MAFNLCIIFLLFIVTIVKSDSILEKHCSKFEFEEKVLEKLIKLEIKVDMSLQEMKKSIVSMESSLSTMTDENKEFKMNIEENVKQVKLESELLQEQVQIGLNNLTRESLSVREHLEEQVKSGISNMTKASQSIQDSFTGMVSQFENKGKLLGEKEHVAFVTYQPKKLTLDMNAAIIYGTVLLNMGNGYSDQTGKFTAPVPGTYMFTAQICGKAGNYTYYQLIVNGAIYSTSTHYEGSTTACSSVTNVAYLKVGDTVYVRGVGSSGSIVIENIYSRNMFSGALVN